MKRTAPSLDSFFDAARSEAPAVPKDDAYRSFRLHSGAAPRHAFSLTNTRTYLVAGSAMALILALAFLVPSLLRTPAQEPVMTALKQSTPPGGQGLMKDDSITQRELPVHRSQEPFTANARNRYNRSTESPSTSVSDFSQALPVHQVSCSPDNIYGLRVFELDSAELRRLGITTFKDGYVKFVANAGQSGSVAMQEISRSLVSYRFYGFSLQLDSNYLLPHLYLGIDQDSVRAKTETAKEKLALSKAAELGLIPPALVLDSNLFWDPDPRLDRVFRDLFRHNQDTTWNEPGIVLALITNIKGRLFHVSPSIDSIGLNFQGPDLSESKIDRESLSKKSISLAQRLYSLEDMVPVCVRPSNGGPDPAIKDYFYIFWFEPTPELLAAIPERVRKVLRKDDSFRRNMREEIHQQNTPWTNRNLEACVYPNPVTQDVATVHYSLPEASRVAVSLYDITGTRMRELSVCESRNEGNWENLLSLQGVPAGMYLLAVTTERGEQAVQKIIVQR
jgi:hypothetical protein